MKWRFLKITSAEIIWGTNDLTREDLIALKNGRYEAIINVTDGTTFDPSSNSWLPIEGQK